MNRTQTDKKKYALLHGWIAERINQLLEDIGKIARALKLSKTITNFMVLWKSNKSLWDKAEGVKQQYLKTGNLTERK